MRITLIISAMLICTQWQAAAQTPGDWKTLTRQLGSVSKDSTLTDSTRNAKIRSLVLAYTSLLQKNKPAGTTMVIRDTIKGRVDTVLVPAADRKIVIHTDSLQMALLKQDLEAHTMQGAGTLLYVLLFFLLAMTTAICWVLAGATGRIHAIQVSLSTLHKKDMSPPVGDRPVPAIAEPVIVPPLITQPALEDPPPETPPPLPPILPLKECCFIAEMMMTAGPRKKFMSDPHADKDLGEDVCGFVIRGDTIAVWLLDGTSDLHCLRDPASGKEYFSSRLLAQHIGDGLRRHFSTAEGSVLPLDMAMDLAIEKVKSDWIAMINELPATEKAALKRNVLDRNIPECASTLLTARLTLDGDLEAYRSGDSKMLLFREGQGRLIPEERAFTTKHPESNDRIFFRLVLDEEGRLDIMANRPQHELLQERGICDLMAFSDGIGPMTERILQDVYPVDAGAARTEIQNEHQGTGDDKSICLIRIRENC